MKAAAKESIGVVMAAYNGERFIEAQLASILNQSRPADEIVVVDDGSTDRTGAILQAYAGRDPRIRLHHKARNQGYVRAFADGIARSSCDLTALSDQDDIWATDKLEKCSRALAGRSGCGMCYHQSALIDAEGREIGALYGDVGQYDLPLSPVEARRAVLQTVSPLAGFSMCFTRTLREKLLPMPGYRLCGHDWWICALAFFMFRPIYIEDVLAYYRIHDAQASGAKDWLLSGTPWASRKRLFDGARIKRNLKRECRRLFHFRAQRRHKQRDRCLRRLEFAEALDQLLLVLHESGPNDPATAGKEMIREIRQSRARLMQVNAKT